MYAAAKEMAMTSMDNAVPSGSLGPFFFFLSLSGANHEDLRRRLDARRLSEADGKRLREAIFGASGKSKRRRKKKAKKNKLRRAGCAPSIRAHGRYVRGPSEMKSICPF